MRRPDAPPRQSLRRRRLALLATAVATVAAGLTVHFLLAGPVADFAGDALYAVLVYLVIAFVQPRLPSVSTGAVALLLCAAVETFQLTGIPHDITERFPPAALLLGSTFSGLDLLAYALGAALAAAVDAALRSRSRSGSQRRPDQPE